MNDNIKDITSTIESWIESTSKDIARNVIDSYHLKRYVLSLVQNLNLSVEEIILIYKEIASRDVRGDSRSWLISTESAEKMAVRQMVLGVLQVSLLAEQGYNTCFVKSDAL